VATATTTPVITLSTSITGLLAGNGTAISAASLTGDVSNIGVATTVVGVNGAAVPASATVIGSNAAKQLVSETAAAISTFLGLETVGNVTAVDVQVFTSSGTWTAIALGYKMVRVIGMGGGGGGGSGAQTTLG